MHRPRARQQEYLRCWQHPPGRRRPPGADRARFWAWRCRSEGASIGRWTPLLGRAAVRRNAHLRVTNSVNATCASPQPTDGWECTRCTGRKCAFPSGKCRFSAGLWWSIPKGRNTVFYRGPNPPRWLCISPRDPAHSGFCPFTRFAPEPPPGGRGGRAVMTFW